MHTYRKEDYPFVLTYDHKGRGWHHLIVNVLSRVNELIKNHPDPKVRDRLRITNIKDKYGRLCFSTNFFDPQVAAMLDEAEHQSEDICDVCESPGKEVMNDSKWVRTLCAEHAALEGFR